MSSSHHDAQNHATVPPTASLEMADGPLVVVVDDNPGDIELIRIAFAIAEIKLALLPAPGGREGIDLLGRLAHDGRRPHLVLLDLNMPRVDGFAVLKDLGVAYLRAVPVIVFSSSVTPAHREFALALGARAFVSKQLGFDKLLAVVETFRPYLGAERIDAG